MKDDGGAIAALLFSLPFLALGYLYAFQREASWRYTVWLNKTKGVKSERTDAWDKSMRVSGIVCIALSLCTMTGAIVYLCIEHLTRH